MSGFNSQIENRNFLSPIGFKFTLGKYPKVAYFCQSANVPSITMSTPIQSSPMRGLPIEGFMDYEPLNLQFLIDEDLTNYMIMHNWIRGLATPDGGYDRIEFDTKMKALYGSVGEQSADGTLTVLNSNFQMNFNVVFQNLIPTSLSALEFNATVDGTEYAMGQVSFKYLKYEIQETTTYKRDKRLS
jgi:hypothetical protein